MATKDDLHFFVSSRFINFPTNKTQCTHRTTPSSSPLPIECDRKISDATTVRYTLTHIYAIKLNRTPISVYTVCIFNELTPSHIALSRVSCSNSGCEKSYWSRYMLKLSIVYQFVKEALSFHFSCKAVLYKINNILYADISLIFWHKIFFLIHYNQIPNTSFVES